MKQKEIAVRIARAAITACLPDRVVVEGLGNLPSCRGNLIVVAIGKAAYTMAKAARAAVWPSCPHLWETPLLTDA